MSDIVELMDKIVTQDHRVTADILDGIRVRIGKDRVDEWNALIDAASHLRMEAYRRDPEGEFYKRKVDQEELIRVNDDVELHRLREQGLKGVWRNTGRGGVDLTLFDNEVPVISFVMKNHGNPVSDESRTDFRRARQEVSTVALMLRALGAFFNPVSKQKEQQS